MAEIRTVTTLKRKRDEISASIRLYEKKLEQGPAPTWRTSRQRSAYSPLPNTGIRALKAEREIRNYRRLIFLSISENKRQRRSAAGCCPATRRGGWRQTLPSCRRAAKRENSTVTAI